MLLHSILVFAHLLLFVFWLGGDVGVYILGQHFRKRDYPLETRISILKLLVINDMVPRTAWCLMVPMSLTIVKTGGYWDLQLWILALSWIIGGFWLWLVWDAHSHDQTPRAKRDRQIEFWLKIGIAIFYLCLGGVSLFYHAPLAPLWLASKALLFGLIFCAAIMIDVVFKPVGPQLMDLIKNGSNDATEIPLRKTMDKTGRWVKLVYALLFLTAFLGAVKPF